MCVMVEVVMYLEVIVSQFLIVGETVMEGYAFATVIHLAVYGVGYDTCICDCG